MVKQLYSFHGTTNTILVKNDGVNVGHCWVSASMLHAFYPLKENDISDIDEC